MRLAVGAPPAAWRLFRAVFREAGTNDGRDFGNLIISRWRRGEQLLCLLFLKVQQAELVDPRS